MRKENVRIMVSEELVYFELNNRKSIGSNPITGIDKQ